MEIKIVQTLNKKDVNNKFGIVRMLDSFYFRKHMVLVFELLGLNLYRYMRSSSFIGLSKDELKSIASQVLI